MRVSTDYVNFSLFHFRLTLSVPKDLKVRVFENSILRRIFEPKRDENGEWRRLYNEELHSLYRSPNIVRVIKSRRLTWATIITNKPTGDSKF